MKKFKEFRTEQKYIAEIGPIGALVGALVGGIAAYKGGKALWNKFKGWKESRKEKKDNQKDGYEIEVKTLNPVTGKEETLPYFIDPKKKNPGNSDLAKMGVKIKNHKNPNNDDITKIESQAGKDVKRFNAKIKGQMHRTGDVPDEDLPANMVQMKRDAEAEVEPDEPTEPDDDGLERDEEGNLKNKKDAEDYFDKNKKAPSGWTNVGDEGKPDLIPTKEAEKKKDEPSKTQGKVTGKDTSGGALKALAKKQGISAQNILSFGEFIAEDVMSDLKKATKSKKDSEISLDDGSDIPIDPLTAEILVKYIEGLDSSEKNKTIKQIQRTERAFMKVLGKAHGE